MSNVKSKRFKIISNNGIDVTIRFLDSGIERHYTAIDLDTIRTKIQEGEEINLDGCYIKNFSYKALSEDSSKPLVKFHAQSSIWDGNVDFSGAQFGDGDVSFRFAQFGNGNISFRKARFGDGEVDFFSTYFGDGNVDFSDAHFGDGDVDFCFTHFEAGDVNFHSTQFGDGNVEFYGAQFGKGNVNFCLTQFGNGKCNFKEITAGETSFFFSEQSIYSHITLGFRALKKLEFNKCTSNNVIEFQETTLGQNGIKELVFLDFCNLGTIRINWDVYKKALMDYKGDLETEAAKLEKIKSEEFKMLKEIYHNQGEYDWEDEAYVEFKKRYTKGLKNQPFRKGLLNLLSVVGKFGTDYMSIAWTMLTIVFVWGILYALPWAAIYPACATRHWWSPFYYSVITFFTVGYGDLSAQNGFTAFFCAVESFLGVFLMAYFSVAVVRKILR